MFWGDPKEVAQRIQLRMKTVLRYSGCMLFLAGPPWLAAQTSSACPTAATDAFTGCYYGNVNLSGSPAFVRTDKKIDFYWGNRSPDSSLPALNFSARWQGYFAFAQGTYTFTALASDGVRLYIDGNLVIDRWRDQAPFIYRATRTLSQGSHLIVMEYYEQTGGATAQLSWQNNSPVTQAPLVSSFSASPASTTPGKPVTLAWNVSGAASVKIDNGVGDVTNRSSITVFPAQTTTYTLTALNSTGPTTATAKATVAAIADTQPPSAPTLVSATAGSGTAVALVWTAGSDNTGVAGYQIHRNGSPLGSVSAPVLTYSDTSVTPGSSYTYIVKAYDASANYSTASNAVQVAMPAASLPSGSCPAPATEAFTGCYYGNRTLSGSPALVRTDNKIDFYWGNRSPDPVLAPLNFSARWQGRFTFGAGSYTFTTVASDGMRFYVDGELLIDRWRDQPPFLYKATRALSAGSHLLVVEYYQLSGGATAQLSWQNNAPAAQPPQVSSFTLNPSSVAAGQPVTLSWNIPGAASIHIDNGVGDVTNRSTVTVFPARTTTYLLTASNSTGSVTASAKVVVAAAGDTQSPTAPTLISATAKSATAVDLVWTAGFDSSGIAGYQIHRNGSLVGSVPGTALMYTDTSVNQGFTYTYMVRAYDAAGNFSNTSNAAYATVPLPFPNVSVTWHGACWQPATIYGRTGNFQAMDFVLKTPTPAPVQATLFFAPNCDPVNGTDNMNDFNALTGSTHMAQGFTFHPDVMPTSALFWVGSRTVDGRCPVGSPCSGCVNYTKATPECSTLP